MDGLLLWLGRAAGFGGLLLCVVAVVLRLLGRFYLGTFQLGTLLQAGIAAIAAACFLLLLVTTAHGHVDGSKRARE